MEQIAFVSANRDTIYLNANGFIIIMSEQDTPPIKKKKNEGMLPKMELLIIFVFFISFILWAMSKCSSTQEAYEQEDATEVVQETEKAVEEKEVAPKLDSVAISENPRKERGKTEKVTVLYVILDGLKLRSAPHLDSAIVKTLPLNTEVSFLNEVSTFKQKINLGDRVAFEPWIKVRVYTGHEGWVYGAGVHYFKPMVLDTLSNN